MVRDYATAWGGDAKPLIRVANTGGRGFAFEDGGTSDHDEGYIVVGLALRGPGSGVGFFFYNNIDNVMLCDVDVDGFALGIQVSGSNAPANADSDAKNSRITLRSSRIVNNSQQGWLGGCDGCSLEYNDFENNGFERDTLLHNVYLGRGDDQRVIGNELRRNANVGGACAAASLVAHGEFHGLLIEGNLIQEELGAARTNCWGIAVDTGYSGTAEGFTNVAIRGNTVINVGNIGIGLNACQNCVIENNVVVQEQAFGATGIAVPDRTREANDLVLSHVLIRNNSLYVGAASTGTGIVLGGEGSGHVLVSNAIHYAGTSSSWSCFALDQPLASYDAIDNDLCYAPASSGQWVRGRGDLAAWQSYSGTSGLSSTADPLYSSVSGAAYLLSPASALSPLVDAGHLTLSAPLAIGEVAREAQPDIGAYEFTNANEPPVDNTATDVRVNFQPASSPVPTGYRVDSGVAFGGRGNGQSYGWNANNASTARDRNASNSPDQRYDTLQHMQKAENRNARWELQLPSGTYRVHIVAGDAGYFDSVFRISAEGVLVVAGTPNSATRSIEGTAAVTVTDGRLTITNGPRRHQQQDRVHRGQLAGTGGAGPAPCQALTSTRPTTASGARSSWSRRRC